MAGTTVSNSKPAPSISAFNQPYWDYARQHELRLQKCRQCKRFWAPPGPVCPHCFSSEFAWESVSGRGVIGSWVRFHKAYHPSFENERPFTVALIELVEGPRLITNVLAGGEVEFQTGTPVEVEFEDCGGFTLPQFRPVAAAAKK